MHKNNKCIKFCKIVCQVFVVPTCLFPGVALAIVLQPNTEEGSKTSFCCWVNIPSFSIFSLAFRKSLCSCSIGCSFCDQFTKVWISSFLSCFFLFLLLVSLRLLKRSKKHKTTFPYKNAVYGQEI